MGNDINEVLNRANDSSDSSTIEEIIREKTWNICKDCLINGKFKRYSNEKHFYVDEVSIQIERLYGSGVENLFRSDSQDEIEKFFEKYLPGFVLAESL